MTQNIYDDPVFFKNYMEFPRSRLGLAGAPEWASLSALLPALAGLNIVDLGCGLGWFCRYARRHGAAFVEGIDISRTMIEEARQRSDDPHIHYTRADLAKVALAEQHYDLAFSSLAFHYLQDFDRMVRAVFHCLRDGAFFVFTVEHPIFLAPSEQHFVDINGRVVWPLDHYLNEGIRNTQWLGARVIKYHRTIGTMLNSLVRAGFSVDHVDEWRPDKAQLHEHPEWLVELNRPVYLLIKARKP